MPIKTEFIISFVLALGIAFAISFASTPMVKNFAEKIGALDVPGDARQVHDHTIPRMGGLAIFLGFVLTVVLFADITLQVQGILLGAVVIVAVGAVDDVVRLGAGVKFLVQICAALLPVFHGVRIDVVANPFVFHTEAYVLLGRLSVPLTVFWIVAITNSVNLIDGLDGLAVGVSTISSITMLIISLIVSENNVVIILAALAGACMGFMPYNMNPAKIFMGDTGALLLGYILSTVSVIGLFKFSTVVSFAVPLLALAVPLTDTFCAFFRRLLKGQNPMKPDRGHFHHQLIDMGLSQKQAVAILYCVSAIMGVVAVVLSFKSSLKYFMLIPVFILAGILWFFLYEYKHRRAMSACADVKENLKEQVSDD